MKTIKAIVAGVIILWMVISFSSCSSTSVLQQPVLLELWFEGRCLIIRGKADSVVVFGGVNVNVVK